MSLSRGPHRGSDPDLNLVRLHGWGMHPGVWSALPADLAPGRVCHDIALPGHGGRPFTAAIGTNLTAWAADCLAQAPARAVWLGWSLGGLVALAAAYQAPARVAALVLITATPRFAQAPDWPQAMPTPTLRDFALALQADPAATLERFLALQVKDSEGARLTLRRLRQGLAQAPAPNPAALAAGLRLLADGDLRALLPRLAIPSLWLFGEHDRLVPAAVAADLPSMQPRAQVHCIAGAGHAALLSHPAAVAAHVTAFLGGSGTTTTAAPASPEPTSV